jgi:hypothetical protein
MREIVNKTKENYEGKAEGVKVYIHASACHTWR